MTYIHTYKMYDYGQASQILLCVIQSGKPKSADWEHVWQVDFSLGQHTVTRKYMVLSKQL